MQIRKCEYSQHRITRLNKRCFEQQLNLNASIFLLHKLYRRAEGYTLYSNCHSTWRVHINYIGNSKQCVYTTNCLRNGARKVHTAMRHQAFAVALD